MPRSYPRSATPDSSPSPPHTPFSGSSDSSAGSQDSEFESSCPNVPPKLGGKKPDPPMHVGSPVSPPPSHSPRTPSNSMESRPDTPRTPSAFSPREIPDCPENPPIRCRTARAPRLNSRTARRAARGCEVPRGSGVPGRAG